jgi:hypothetical protein
LKKKDNRKVKDRERTSSSELWSSVKMGVLLLFEVSISLSLGGRAGSEVCRLLISEEGSLGLPALNSGRI